MRRWVLLIAGCYGPVVSEGVPCGVNTACPHGQTCDPNGTCRSTIGDAGGDLDGPPGDRPPGDGPVSDATDAAPGVCTAGGHDEDQDGFGDACDPCPHLAGGLADGDGDGVGDACDPHPGEADRIVVFEAFASAPSGWSLPNGWSISGGDLVATAGGGSTIASLAGVGRDVTIVSNIDFQATPGGTDPNAAVLANVASASEFYKCAIHAAPRIELVRHQQGAGGVVTLDQAALPSSAWLLSRVTISTENGALACTADRGPDHRDVTATSTALSNTGIGLRVREGVARFAYVVVIARQ